MLSNDRPKQSDDWIALPALVFLVAMTTGLFASAAPRSTRIDLFPKLQAGQILNYAITYRAERQTKTKSSITLAQSPGDAVMNVRALLRVEILGVTSQGSRAIIHARGQFQSLDADAAAGSREQMSAGSAQSTAASPSQQTTSATVEFSILSDGRLDQITGLDALSLDLQQAWQQWAARFAGSAVFPPDGIRPTQKWRSAKAERSPSPIAGLTWIRESTYVRNEPCRPLRFTSKGDLVESEKPADTCPVIRSNNNPLRKTPRLRTTASVNSAPAARPVATTRRSCTSRSATASSSAPPTKPTKLCP